MSIIISHSHHEDMGPFTIGVLLLGQRNQGLCTLDLNVYYDLILFH